MQSGGYATWTVPVFGAVTLVAAGAFVLSPKDHKIAFIRAMSTATLFLSVSGTLAGVAAVMHNVPTNPEWANSPNQHLIVMTGLGEAMSSSILGLSILALAWLVTAVGILRCKL
jgi:hypothetical protein